MNSSVPCVLTIAGLDPSGGAGLPADARACTAFGAHALPVATAVIAQNTQGVVTFEPVAPALLAAQLDTILEDITPCAVKTGMIPSAEAVEVIASRVAKLGVPLIVDPVFVPSSGQRFANDEAIVALSKYLLPLCEMVTPNWREAVSLNFGELEEEIQSREWKSDAENMALKIENVFFLRHYPQYVLLKGGDVQNSNESSDLLLSHEESRWLTAPRVHGYEVRGTGCMLASAIAAQRAQNIPVLEAVAAAKTWLTGQIKNAQPLGKGRRVAVGG